MTGERDNLRASEIVLPGDCGHFCERLEKDAGRIGPSLTTPADEKMAVSELPLGRLFNEHGLNTLTHANPLPDSPTEPVDVGFAMLSPALTTVVLTAPHFSRDASGSLHTPPERPAGFGAVL